MSTWGAHRYQQKLQKSCGNCRVPISWVDICTTPTSLVYRPIYTFWPPAPAYLTEYDFFETADAYVSPPNWNQVMEQSLGSNITTCSPSISYDCVSAASNVQQVGRSRTEEKETYLRTESFQVRFAWYGARRNPLYPGTYGAPPYIRELVPFDKTYNNGVFDRERKVYQKDVTVFTQFKGWIDCSCGQPSQCGC